jgi:hypothetical protein
MKPGIGQWLQTKSKASNSQQHRRQPATFCFSKKLFPRAGVEQVRHQVMSNNPPQAAREIFQRIATNIARIMHGQAAATRNASFLARTITLLLQPSRCANIATQCPISRVASRWLHGHRLHGIGILK